MINDGHIHLVDFGMRTKCGLDSEYCVDRDDFVSLHLYGQSIDQTPMPEKMTICPNCALLIEAKSC